MQANSMIRTGAVLALLLVLGGARGARHGAAIRAAASSPQVAIRSVSVVTDSGLDVSARYGIGKLIAALRDRGLQVTEPGDGVASSDVVVVAGLATGDGPAAAVLRDLRLNAPQGTESLTVRRAVRYQGKPAVLLAGGDGVGTMYAALDTADRVRWAASSSEPFQHVRDADETPFLRRRGVVIFTMNQAYFESRLLNERYLERYLDTLATSRINQLVVTFGYENGGYMAPPYPYFFDVDAFPNVKVVGLTTEQQTRNRLAFKTLLRLAAERGVTIKVGIWDHIYRGGGQRGAVVGAADGTQPTPGLVWGIDGDNVVAYTAAGLRKFYDTFPEIRETQFRMHNESGLRNPEIEPFWEKIWSYFRTDKPDMLIEMRAKGLSRATIKDAQDKGLKIVLDTKIWMEQMGLPYHPSHINKQNQGDQRHSYGGLLDYPQTYRMNWTLWNGGTQRQLIWADPTYARRLAQSAKLYDGDTLAVTEMQATKLLGDPHSAPPRDFLSEKYRYFDWEFERYWAFYRVWGRLAYNPDASSDVWEQPYTQRFGQAAGPHIMRAVHLASQVLPRVVAASSQYRMFPTTTGWPEMMRQGSLQQWADTEEGSDIVQFMNLKDAAASILAGTDTAMRRPEATAHWFSEMSDAILNEIAAAESAFGGTPSRELLSTAADVKALAAMARYHAARQLGGVAYNLYKQSGDLTAFDEAIAYERRAVQAWSDIVTSVGDFYSEDMAFGTTARGYPRHWRDELKLLQADFDRLLEERKGATGKPVARPVRVRAFDPAVKPPVATLQPPPAATPRDRDLVVRASVSAPAGLKSAVLRYRHVNQHEDYLSVSMTLDARTGLYAAAIPAAFVNSSWDVMYFVEVVDKAGTGRIYPDLDVETPYVVVKVARQ